MLDLEPILLAAQSAPNQVGTPIDYSYGVIVSARSGMGAQRTPPHTPTRRAPPPPTVKRRPSRPAPGPPVDNHSPLGEIPLLIIVS